jgi:hypothetical protein
MLCQKVPVTAGQYHRMLTAGELRSAVMCLELLVVTSICLMLNRPSSLPTSVKGFELQVQETTEKMWQIVTSANPASKMLNLS